jgi:type II secretory pathway component PulM
MAFEDLKDQLSERAQGYWSRIQESSIYIQLHEKYADLSPTSQKIVLGIGSLVLIFFTLMIPWSYISSSQQSIADFEANKTLLRDLFRVSRASAELEGAPPQVDPNALATRAQSQLGTMSLQAEQIEKVIAVDNALGGPGIPGVPKAVQQKGIEVTLRKLNVRQVIEIGYQLLTLQPHF